MIKVNPENEEVYFLLVRCCNEIKDYTTIVKYLSNLLEISPDNSDAYHKRGLTHYLLGNDDDAVIDLEKAKELGQQDVVDILNRIKESL